MSGQFLDYGPCDAIGSANVPLVSIITCCQHRSMMYGTLLTFKTLRIGFPTAEVEVWDNGSAPELVDEIRAAAEAVGARFTAMTGRNHMEHLRWILLRRPAVAGRTVVLADPDLVFYEPVQDWDFTGYLMAGRLMPEMRNNGILTRQRLHPSLTFIPCMHALRRALPDEHASKWNAIGGIVKGPMGRVAYDTLAPMYAVLRKRCKSFTPAHLDAFSHLFLGTHLGPVGVRPDGAGAVLYDAHNAAATGDLEALRGIWPRQETYFRGEAPLTTLGGEASIRAMRATAEWQAMSYPDAELEGARLRVLGRLTMGAPTNRWDPTPPHERR